jgi:hypothetical protein
MYSSPRRLVARCCIATSRSPARAAPRNNSPPRRLLEDKLPRRGWPGRSGAPPRRTQTEKRACQDWRKFSDSGRTSPGWRLWGRDLSPICLRGCATLRPGHPSLGATRFPSAASPQGRLRLARLERLRLALLGRAAVFPCFLLLVRPPSLVWIVKSTRCRRVARPTPRRAEGNFLLVGIAVLV